MTNVYKTVASVYKYTLETKFAAFCVFLAWPQKCNDMWVACYINTLHENTALCSTQYVRTALYCIVISWFSARATLFAVSLKWRSVVYCSEWHANPNAALSPPQILSFIILLSLSHTSCIKRTPRSESRLNLAVNSVWLARIRLGARWKDAYSPDGVKWRHCLDRFRLLLPVPSPSVWRHIRCVYTRYNSRDNEMNGSLRIIPEPVDATVILSERLSIN